MRNYSKIQIHNRPFGSTSRQYLSCPLCRHSLSPPRPTSHRHRPLQPSNLSKTIGKSTAISPQPFAALPSCQLERLTPIGKLCEYCGLITLWPRHGLALSGLYSDNECSSCISARSTADTHQQTPPRTASTPWTLPCKVRSRQPERYGRLRR